MTIQTREGATEAICAWLHDHGCAGVAYETCGALSQVQDTSLGQWYDQPLNDIAEGDAVIQAYFPSTVDAQAIARNFAQFHLSFDAFGLDGGTMHVTWETVTEEDWAHAWKTHFKPLAVGQRLLIQPTWEPLATSDRLVVWLDPGMAFGTGHHVTTIQSLLALEQVGCVGHTVVDVGTGSGILAIAAARLGAKQVIALDLDPVAVSSVRDNVHQNGLDDTVSVRTSDMVTALRHADGTFQLHAHLVVSNILAELLIPQTTVIFDLLHTGGVWIAAGIIQEKAEAMVHACKRASFLVEQQTTTDGWVVLVLRKGTPECGENG